MYNPDDDKELDRLSREAAGNYEPPGHASWEHLSQELDKVLPDATEKKERRRFFYWWLLPCLLVAGGIYRSTQHTKSGTVVGSKTAGIPLQKDKTTIIPGTNNILPPSNIGRQAIVLPPNSKTALPGNDAARNSKTDRLLHSDIAVTTTKTGTDPATDQPSIQSANDDRIIANNNVQSANTDITAVKKGSDSITTPIITSITDTTNNLQQPKASKKAYPSLQSRFSISVLTGVDISTVKFRYASDMGYNAGLLGGYHFNNRWSLHTGVIYTKKNYKMAGSDFTAPKGTAPSYWALETVEGYCQMWEVPLLMRYSFVNKTNRRFFVSTGLSSYFMTKESYDYYYPFNNRIVTRNGTYNSGEKYLFSIAHFSAGIEQHVGKNLSMLIEPYAKIPVSGVGFGSIKLSSLGVNLALQYRLSRHQ